MVKILIKTSRNPKHEFYVQKTLYTYFPRFIAKPIKLKKNKIYMKFYKKRSLNKLCSLTPVQTKNLIRKVFYIIRKIQKKFPLFRHNDLHVGNILIDDKNQIRITDFELTRLQGKTPKVLPNYGITNKRNKNYDTHMFLNSLREWCLKRKNFRSVAVIDKMLPKGYRGKEDTFVRNWRLKA